jgi:hypothetical protein
MDVSTMHEGTLLEDWSHRPRPAFSILKFAFLLFADQMQASMGGEKYYY